jgi:DNA-binding MarR family transcriptional regulator
MSLLPTTLNFGETTLTIIDRNGEPWLSARELARALGYADERGVLRIYSRNTQEFTDEMTCVVNLTTQVDDQRRDIRVFSPRGCHLIAMLSRTEQAKAFRRWVLDVLEAHVKGSGPQCRLVPLLGLTRKRWGQIYTPHGFNSVSLNAALVLDYLLEHCDDGKWHTLTHREIGGAVGISHTSVRNVLVRLDEWGLITREPSGTQRPARLRVHSGRIRQQLKHGRLTADDSLPWLH